MPEHRTVWLLLGHRTNFDGNVKTNENFESNLWTVSLCKANGTLNIVHDIIIKFIFVKNDGKIQLNLHTTVIYKMPFSSKYC